LVSGEKVCYELRTLGASCEAIIAQDMPPKLDKRRLRHDCPYIALLA
jgi:hypothetical protein